MNIVEPADLSLEDFASFLEASDGYKVLRRYSCPGTYRKLAPSEVLRTGLIIDTETTSLDTETAKVIELAMVSFSYDEEGRVCEVIDAHSWLGDPSEKLSDEVKRVTGITDAELVGKEIDWHTADTLIGNAHLVIAHNAKFDRPIIERHTHNAEVQPWACSMAEIDWRGLGAPTTGLQPLCWWKGFFYDAHRAQPDCLALLHLLAQQHEGQDLMQILLASARLPLVRIWAEGADFNVKDTLKSRGYFWHDGSFGHSKCWHRDVSADEADAEIKWVEQVAGSSPRALKITAMDRYSKRAFL